MARVRPIEIESESTMSLAQLPKASSYISSITTDRESMTKTEQHDALKNFKEECAEGAPENLSHYLSLTVYCATGLAFFVLPWAIFRHILGLETICYEEENRNSIDQECGSDTLKLRSSLFYLVYNIGISSYFPLLLKICGEPHGEDYKKILRYYPIALIFALVGSLAPRSQTMLWSAPATLSGPLISDCMKKHHKGGLYLTTLYLIQFFMTNFLARNLSNALKTPLAFGLNYIIFVPVYVQLNQSAAIYMCERVSPLIITTDFNRDALIAIQKYQMGFLSTLKVASLLPILEEGNIWAPLILTILLDALGRNQVWRLLYRRARARIFGGPVSTKKLCYMSQIVLSSEIDMDYVPIILLLIINAAKSPVSSNLYTTLHVKDDFMTLREDSLLNEPIANLGILVATFLAGDLCTYLFSHLIRDHRVYDIKIVYPKFLRFTAFFVIPTILSSLNLLFIISFSLNPEQMLIRVCLLQSFPLDQTISQHLYIQRVEFK